MSRKVTDEQGEVKEVKKASVKSGSVKAAKAVKKAKAVKPQDEEEEQAEDEELIEEASENEDEDDNREMDEATRAKFKLKMKELLARAKKKKNVLEYNEISDFLSELNLDEEQMDKILEVLEQSGVDVLRMTDDTDDMPDDDEILINEEEDVDMESIDLSVPDGISIEDPVRMYLKEIGKVPLLTAD